ncbi:MAG: DNA polymerase III subunit delta' [Chloroflexi bacterium]|nr:DNA polymerase III subunit delta' [Chloroflexota bacterium]
MWSIIGHEAAVRFLGQSLARDALAHAYLILGPPHVGKGTLAMNLAQAVNCEKGGGPLSLGPPLLAKERGKDLLEGATPFQASLAGAPPLPTGEGAAIPCGECAQCRRIAAGRHADVVVLRVEGSEGRKVITIDQVREVQRQASLKPYEGRCRVFIFDRAEDLSEEASNCLLKTLEEPPPQTLLLLLAANEETLLPTVRSRCQRIELRPLPEGTVASALEARFGVAPEKARGLARLSRGALGWAIHAARDPSILEERSRRLERLTSLPGASLEERFAYAAELAGLFTRDRPAVQEVLALWVSWWRDMIVVHSGLAEAVANLDQLPLLQEQGKHYPTEKAARAVRAILRSSELLELNANPRLVLEGLMLAVPQPAQAQVSSG